MLFKKVCVYICRWEHLIYQFAGHDEIIEAVVCGGVVAYEKKA